MFLKNYKSRVMIIVAFLSTLLFSSLTFAAQWYEYYLDAENAAASEAWVTAIDNLKKAIEKEPRPEKSKRAYGMRRIDYYPYLKLGFAYLAIGNIQEAQSACEQSKKYGVAPETELNECFQRIIKLTGIAAPIPTQAPVIIVPSPAPVSSTPLVSTDTPPQIMVVEIPPTIEGEILTIQIAGADDHGIKEIRIVVKKPDSRGLIIASDPIIETPRSIQQTFDVSKNLSLDPGKNEILIEAIDTSWQITQETVTVFRQIPQVPHPERKDQVYAVIIGIGDYQDDRIPDLRFTENDAQGLYNVLTDPAYGGIPQEHIKLLLHKDATVSNIKSAIGTWLRAQADEQDTVLIYYAGHGAPEGNETYWVTYEANIDDLYATALSNNDVSDMLTRIQSKRMITFLDACYSAATVKRTKGTRGMPTEIPWEKFQGTGRITITASNGKQESLEDEEYGHGVFTYHLLEGLKGKADGFAGTERDGVVDVDEIWNYVRERVKADARQRGNLQEPVLQTDLYSSGIPLTYNLKYFEEQQKAAEAKEREQEIQQKQKKLAEFYEHGDIQTEHFECALEMLASGAPPNKYLEDLLSGKISAKTFNQFFTCEP